MQLEDEMAEKKKPAPTTGIPSRRQTDARRTQKFLVVWIDATIDEIKNNDSIKTVSKLREITDDVTIFTDVDECVDFITNVQEEQTILISSGTLGQIVVPIVHDMTQVNTIYVFCGDKSRHEGWAQQWSKIKGIFTNIKPLCEALRKLHQQYNQNPVAVSFVAPTTNTINKSLDELDQSFVYSTILKEIILSIDFEERHLLEFVSYCREKFVDNNHELKNIDKFEREYHQHTPVWWYTYDSFMYPMVNRALRTMDFDMIIKFAFFLRDFLEQIAQLHSEQCSGGHHSNVFTVYRGQNLAKGDFDQLLAKKGGLLSFTNFLSVVPNRQVSLQFINSSTSSSDQVGVLFVMKIDSSVSLVPFADLRNLSYYENEDEILLSMNSVFRIEEIQLMDPNRRIWQVNLTMTGDEDLQMRHLTDCIREETCPEENGWFRLGQLLIKLAQFNQAEGVYTRLLNETHKESKKANIHQRLGRIKKEQGQYEEGVIFYEKAIEIQKKTLSANHPDLGNSYSDIGIMYERMGEYTKALSYDEKGLAVHQKSLPSDHPNIAVSYSSIGTVYESMGEFSKALAADEKALYIRQKSLPPIHPDIATSHNNIGSVYQKMGEYVDALSSQGKAFVIFQKSLPGNHPLLAASYEILGRTLNSMGDYPKALTAHEKAVAIQQKILPPNHPDIAASNNNIGEVYVNMDNYSKALKYFQNALEMAQRTLPSNHPSLQLYQTNLEDAKKHCKQ